MPGDPTRRVLAEERGLTLTELLVAVVCAMIVLLAGLAFLSITVNSQQRNDRRSTAVLDAREAIGQLVKDARVALPVAGQSPAVAAGSFVMQRTAPGANPANALSAQPKQWVRWSCGGTTCQRSTSSTYPPPGGGRTYVTSLANADVFTLSGTNFLDAKLRVGVTGQSRPVEIRAGALMRSVP